MPADLHYLSLNEVARQIRGRKLSSLEATRAMLDRIARIDPDLKSYATATPERALSDAKRLDDEAQIGRFRGALHGVPIAVKDLCNTAGVATAAGMAIHRGNVPAKDATVVARLKGAGAVILGKLQMTEGAFGAHHPSIPPPKNPWNAAYWSGASSSGSGAATAAGLCFGSLGSDTGGSIRFPSTQNGVTGLKPTWGRVSRAGVFALADSLDHIGPMARSALDCALLLGAIAGADADDPTAAPLAVPDYAVALGKDGGSGVRGKKLGVPNNLIGLDADARRVFDAAVAGFKSAGAELIEVALPASAEQGARDWLPLCAVETALAHEATYPARAAEYGPVLAAFIEAGRQLPVLEYARLQARRAALTGDLSRLMASLDFMLVPAMGTAAWTIAALDQVGRDPDTVAARLRYTAPFDLSGQPTLTLPGGFTADGAPVGFQVVGRAFDEAGILAAGHAFQQASDWHRRHPPL